MAKHRGQAGRLQIGNVTMPVTDWDVTDAGRRDRFADGVLAIEPVDLEFVGTWDAAAEVKLPKAKKAKIEKTGRTKPAREAGKAGKLSAIEAAVRVLGEEGRAMNCKALIETMAAKGYWTSPGGKTPASTLYSSLLKEITTKGKESRFVKVDRGQFALRQGA